MNLVCVFLDLLFPPKCPFCDRLLENGQTLLCPDCQRDLPWTPGTFREGKGEFLTACAAPLLYQDMVRTSHHRYKFSGIRSYAVPYAELMAQCAADRLEADFDVLTWVPLSAKRRRRRGYDQSELLARELSRRMGVPVQRLLNKVRNTPAQSGIKDASARRANVLGAYTLYSGAQVSGRRILLVDDVMTTGSTVSECARILRAAGADAVSCLTLAATGRDER